MEDLPNNSRMKKTGGEPIPENASDEIEKVITGQAIVRKPSGLKRLRSTFIAGDSKTVGEHVIWGLLVPAVKDAIVDMGQTFVEMIILGDRSPRRFTGSTPQQGVGSTSKFNYNGISMGSRLVAGSPSHVQEQPARYNPNEIVVPSRPEADRVLRELYARLNTYGVVTCADLYRAVGVSPNWMDDRFGWKNLDQSGVQRVRDGLLIVLPTPEDLGQ